LRMASSCTNGMLSKTRSTSVTAFLYILTYPCIDKKAWGAKHLLIRALSMLAGPGAI
jgi:hypothetical protein